MLGYNMYAYCMSNPINCVDYCGESAEVFQSWFGGMWWLCGIDAAFPLGDLIYITGIVFLGVYALSEIYPDGIDPHWDYNDVYGHKWRIFKGGRIEFVK